MNRKKRTLVVLVLTMILLLLIILTGFLCTEKAMETDLTRANRPPGLSHLFGTDWMGRDMLAAP